MNDYDTYAKVLDNVTTNGRSTLQRELSQVHRDFLSTMGPFFNLRSPPNPSKIVITSPTEGLVEILGFYSTFSDQPVIHIKGPDYGGDEWYDAAFGGEGGIESAILEILEKVIDFGKEKNLFPYMVTLAHESGHQLHEAANRKMKDLAINHKRLHAQDHHFFPWATLLSERIADLSASAYFRIKGLDNKYARGLERHRKLSNRDLVESLKHLSSSESLDQARRLPYFDYFIRRRAAHFRRWTADVDEIEKKVHSCIPIRNLFSYVY